MARKTSSRAEKLINDREELLKPGDVAFREIVVDDPKAAYEVMTTSAKDQMAINIDLLTTNIITPDQNILSLEENRDTMIDNHWGGYATSRGRYWDVFTRANNPENPLTINEVIRDTLHFVRKNTTNDPQPTEGMAAYVLGHLIDLYFMIDPQKLSEDGFYKLIAINLLQSNLFDPFILGCMYDDIRRLKGSDYRPYDLHTPFEKAVKLIGYYRELLTKEELRLFDRGIDSVVLRFDIAEIAPKGPFKRRKYRGK